MSKSVTAEIIVDGRSYSVEMLRRAEKAPEYPRLVIVSYLPNRSAQEILNVCIRSIRRNTAGSYELWVVDNHSPRGGVDWLVEEPGINLVLNHTEPLPPGKRNFWTEWEPFQRQQRWGSYANAIALELAARLIDPLSHYLMPLHMDILACHPDWLSFLCSKLDSQVRAAGVLLHRDRVPEGALHILGYLVDFQMFRQLRLDFLPDLPAIDVGDRVTLGLRAAGYEVYGCRNTYNEPELAEAIHETSPAKHLKVFRALDDENRVIFMHLSRGVRRSTGEHRRGLTPQEWVSFATQHFLS